jgi:2-phosphosulfolactate phosphatase
MIDVLLSPADVDRAVSGGGLSGAQAVVLDVLRATSTIVSALHAGAREVRLFGSLDAARAARSGWDAAAGPVVLAGESQALKPADFDAGNSPREMVTEKVGGATLLLATTNGTRAAVKATGAGRLFAASLLNASAMAAALLENIDGGHTLFICSGTDGKLALEDVLGAGAILFSLLGTSYRADLPFTDSAWLAYHAFAAVRARLPAGLRLGAGGLNVIDAGLEEDIDWCARLDAMPLVAAIDTATLHVQRVEA